MTQYAFIEASVSILKVTAITTIIILRTNKMSIVAVVGGTISNNIILSSLMTITSAVIISEIPSFRPPINIWDKTARKAKDSETDMVAVKSGEYMNKRVN